MSIRTEYCFNCNCDLPFETFLELNTPALSHYTLLACSQCSAVAAFHVDTSNDSEVRAEYAEYNHLSKFSSQELVARSKRISFSKSRVLKEVKALYGENAVILDFGGGAGIFAKTCFELGFKNTYLFEPSQILREFAIKSLNLPKNKVIASLKEIPENIDVITMFDVIEHLPIDTIEDVFATLVRNMSANGSLIGMTPNVKSLNISIHGERDPVIAPPSHTIYFSSQILKLFLEKVGFYKHKAFTIGFSTNSFFRKDKFKSSWIERPNQFQRLPAAAIRLVFRLMGYALVPVGKGYHCFFWYRLK